MTVNTVFADSDLGGRVRKISEDVTEILSRGDTVERLHRLLETSNKKVAQLAAEVIRLSDELAVLKATKRSSPLIARDKISSEEIMKKYPVIAERAQLHYASDASSLAKFKPTAIVTMYLKQVHELLVTKTEVRGSHYPITQFYAEDVAAVAEKLS